MDGLTPGRIVHFVTDKKAIGRIGSETIITQPGTHVTATVTGLDPTIEGRVILSIDFPGIGLPDVALAGYDNTGMIPGTWHWIERA